MNTKLVEGLLSVYAATGEDPNTIIPIVEEAIQKDPKNPELYAGLGRVYDKLGQADKSIEAFNHALSLAPEDFGTNFNIGLMLIKQGDAPRTTSSRTNRSRARRLSTKTWPR